MEKYKNAIALLLASELIISTLSLLTAPSYHSYLGIFIGLAVNVILSLLGNILNVGQCSFYLNIACGQTYGFSDLFTGFKVFPNKIILSQILVWIFTFLPLLPSVIVSIVSVYLGSSAMVLMVVLTLVLGCLVSCWISLRLSQVNYLLLDFPDYSISKLLRMSWHLMKGNVGRLLYLQLSFLPLLLASVVSFGIGFLFVHPYQYMTYTLFYLDLVTQD